MATKKLFVTSLNVDFLPIIKECILNFLNDLRKTLKEILPPIINGNLMGAKSLIKLVFNVNDIPNIIDDILREIYKKILERTNVHKEEIESLFPSDLFHH